jgi:hypothetical protein
MWMINKNTCLTHEKQDSRQKIQINKGNNE